MMWNRFTERARRVTFHAQEEAARFGENYVGTEHFLLALCRGDELAVVTDVFKRLECDPREVYSEVGAQLIPSTGNEHQTMELTPQATTMMERAYEAAMDLHDNFIGTEHLLLGLLASTDRFVARTLVGYGVTYTGVKEAVLAMRAEEKAKTKAEVVG